jgi:NADPH:quinone reductase-like Zn-dependent oxidoreductase
VSSSYANGTLSRLLASGFRELRRPSAGEGRKTLVGRLEGLRSWQRHADDQPRAPEQPMKALTQDVYGSAEVLQIDDIPTPTPRDDEVLIRVHAAGVGPEVWHTMTGLPYLVRVMGYGLRRPKARVPGRDVAGTVEAVGKDVTQARPGDQVYGMCSGSFAEYACAPAGKVAPKPANLTFEQAAVVPTSATTALQGLRDLGRLEAGQTALIVGASGGVGTFAVQLAVAFGAHVTGVCSTAKVDLVESLGVDRVIDYTREDIADGGHRYDLILDTAGRRSLTPLRRALTARGTLVIVGGEGGDRWTGGFVQRQIGSALLSPLVPQRLRPLVAKERREDLLALNEFIEAGKVTPVIDRRHPLDEAAKALSDDEEGHGRGKKVVVVAPPDSAS